MESPLNIFRIIPNLFISILLFLVIIALIKSVKPNCVSPANYTERFVCTHESEWRAAVRNNPMGNTRTARPPGSPPGPGSKAFDLTTNAQQCMDYDCFCQMQGVCRGRRRTVRREYRMLTDSERSRFHRALNGILRNGDFARLRADHDNIPQMPGAHFGPSFVLWHREFLKRYEFALLAVDPTVSLPCWDSTLDDGLPDPAHSVMFTSELMGEGNNPVNIGATEWGKNVNWSVVRNVNSQNGWPYFYDDVNTWLGRKNIPDMYGAFTCSNPSSSALELGHNNVHVLIGGDMSLLSTAPRDPIFYLHHCYVDCIWYEWTKRNQNPTQHETEYADPTNSNCSEAEPYKLNTTMLPFGPPLKIKDGLQNAYTDNLYTCASIPTCSRANPDCGSKYLFCDIRSNALVVRCMSKIRPGGNCTGFGSLGDAPCYQSTCNNDICQLITTSTVTTTTTNDLTTTPQHETSAVTTTIRTDSTTTPQQETSTVTTTITTLPTTTPQQESTVTTENITSSVLTTTPRQQETSTETTITTTKPMTTPRQKPTSVAYAASTLPTAHYPPNNKQGPVYPMGNSCFNENECCADWAENGECENNPIYMQYWCKAACETCYQNLTLISYLLSIPLSLITTDQGNIRNKACYDKHPLCQDWSEQYGACYQYQDWMTENCRKTCNQCKKGRSRYSKKKSKWSENNEVCPGIPSSKPEHSKKS